MVQKEEFFSKKTKIGIVNPNYGHATIDGEASLWRRKVEKNDRPHQIAQASTDMFFP